MGYNPLANAGMFLVKIFFNLYISIVLLRLILQLIRADFYSPLSQFIIKATNPILFPLRRIIPSIGGIDTASIIFLMLLQFIEIVLIQLLSGKTILLFSINNIIGLSILVVGQLLDHVVGLYTFVIFIMIVLSWIPQGGYNPILSLLQQIIDPLIRPIRSRMPQTSGLDFSPMIVLIVLQLCVYLIIDPVLHYGKGVYIGS